MILHANCSSYNILHSLNHILKHETHHVYTVRANVRTFNCIQLSRHSAAKEGCALWRDAVLPALLPFFICTALMLEMISGASMVVQFGLSPRISATLGAFLFSFGDMCVMAQSALFMKLNIKRHLGTKLLQGLSSATLTYLLFPLMVRGEIAVFDSLSEEMLLTNIFSASGIFAISLLGVSTILLLSVIMHNVQQRKHRSKNAATPFGQLRHIAPLHKYSHKLSRLNFSTYAASPIIPLINANTSK